MVNIKIDDVTCTDVCENLYQKLNSAGVEILYDDRNERTGSKLADMDLIGLPWQVVVGPRSVKNGLVEVKNRRTGETEELTSEAVINRFAG